MAHKPERPAYHALEGSIARAHRLAAYGPPVAETSPPMGCPGCSPPPAIKPGVDERLVIPEAGDEYIDDRVRYEVMAGEPEHDLGEISPRGG